MTNLLLDLCIGTLTKEIQQARQQCLIFAVQAGYTNLHWRIYADKFDIIELWGKHIYQPLEEGKVASIQYGKSPVSVSYAKDMGTEVKTP